VNVSRARRLLRLASAEPERLRRHLLVAAALRDILARDPIVVGGTAEEFWTADEYHPTDLDICAALSPEDEATLERLGFSRDGRHWVPTDVNVAVEFPEATIEGDESRTVEASVGEGSARIIGLDDLYIDRLRQCTMDEQHEGTEFRSALAVGAAGYDRIDWRYVSAIVSDTVSRDAFLGDRMKRVDSRIRRRVRRALR
jgi:hypothetical protein